MVLYNHVFPENYNAVLLIVIFISNLNATATTAVDKKKVACFDPLDKVKKLEPILLICTPYTLTKVSYCGLKS